MEISDKAKTELASGVAVNVGKRDTDYVVNVNSSRVENVPAPVKDGDAANKKYVDDAVKDAAPEGKFLPLAGGTMAASAVVGKTNTLQIGAGPGDGAGVYLSDTIGANMYVGDQAIAVSPNSKGATAGQKQSLMLCKVDNQNAVHCDNMRVVAVGDPVADGDAVNKKYVDAHSGGNYLPLSGGTMRGNINMAENDIVRVSQLAYNGFTGNGPRLDFRANGMYMVYNGVDKFGMDGDSLHAGGLALQDLKDPTEPQDAATKAYVDSKAGVIDKPTSGSIVVDTPPGALLLTSILLERHLTKFSLPTVCCSYGFLTSLFHRLEPLLALASSALFIGLSLLDTSRMTFASGILNGILMPRCILHQLFVSFLMPSFIVIGRPISVLFCVFVICGIPSKVFVLIFRLIDSLIFGLRSP